MAWSLAVLFVAAVRDIASAADTATVVATTTAALAAEDCAVLQLLHSCSAVGWALQLQQRGCVAAVVHVAMSH